MQPPLPLNTQHLFISHHEIYSLFHAKPEISAARLNFCLFSCAGMILNLFIFFRLNGRNHSKQQEIKRMSFPTLDYSGTSNLGEIYIAKCCQVWESGFLFIKRKDVPYSVFPSASQIQQLLPFPNLGLDEASSSLQGN